MIAAIPLQLTGVPPAELRREIAYVIRRYKPGKAPSHYQLEASRADGSHRQVLRTPTEPRNVFWLSKSELWWSDTRGTEWASSYPRWKPKKLKSPIFVSEGHYPAESSFLSLKFGRQLFYDYGSHDGSFFEYKKRKLVKVARPVPEQDIEDVYKIQGLGGSKRTLFEPKGADSAVEQSMTGMPEYYTTRELPNREGLWILAEGAMSSRHQMLGLVYENLSGKQVLVCQDASVIEADPSRRAVIYVVAQEIKMLGSLHLWMNSIRVADWRTGAQRTILSGSVHVGDLAVRPNNPGGIKG